MSRRLLLTAWLLLSLAGGRAAAQTASAPGAAPAPDAAAAAEPAPQHTLGGYLHVDARLFPQENPPQVDRFLLRRVRPSFKGVLWEHYRYKFLVDVASSNLQLLDAYVDVAYVPWLVLRTGKGKVPFGLERLQSATALDFVERGLPTLLGPNRDVGVQLVGAIAGDALTYELGIFNGTADNSVGETSLDDRFELAGRLFARPLVASGVPGLRGLGLAVAATAGEAIGTEADPLIRSYPSAGGSAIFAYASPVVDAPVLAAGDHVRFTTQAMLYEGPLGLSGEYVWARQKVGAGPVLGDFTHQAFAAAATFALTGERATYGSLVPRRPFDPLAGRWGAIELAARYARINFDDEAFDLGLASSSSATGASAITAGINWHLSAVYKLQANFERTDFDMPGGAGPRPAENALLLRAQLSL